MSRNTVAGHSTSMGRVLATLVPVLCGSLLLIGCAAPRVVESALPTGATPRTRVLGSGPRVLLAQVLMPPGSRFSLPTSECQDVLVYVRHGTTELDGGRPLLPGRAVRFGLQGATVRNTSRRDAELYVIVSRSVAQRFGPDATLDMQLAPVDPACGQAAPADGISDLGAAPLVHADGELRVSILLDEAGQGARHAALTRLEASPVMGVPLHTHEESAEVIFIEEGEGRMRVGDQQVAVRPGTFVYIPPRTPHSFSPSGNSALRAVQIYAPAGPEQRFREPQLGSPPATESAPSPAEEPVAPETDPPPGSVPAWVVTPPVAPPGP